MITLQFKDTGLKQTDFTDAVNQNWYILIYNNAKLVNSTLTDYKAANDFPPVLPRP